MRHCGLAQHLTQGIDDRGATIRFDVTPMGFHAQVLSAHGTIYVDPYARGDTKNYVSYFKRDLRNGAVIASNDHWRCSQEAEIIATTIPPSNDLQSAIVRDLAPGAYTAIVRGVSNATGVSVVEAYGLN